MITYHLKTKQITDTCPDKNPEMPKRVVEIFAKKIFEKFQEQQQNNLEWNRSNEDRAYW